MSSNLKKGAFSSVILVAESILKKLVGLVSTLILARVLLPEDFGVIAIATLMIGFIDVLSSTGAQQYLMKVDQLDDNKLNTSFTINVILKGVLALLMGLSSIFIADYYNDPRLTDILLSLTGVFILNNIRNPAIDYLRREQNYTPLVKISLLAKFTAVAVAVFSALMLGNYWALVFGQLANSILMLFGTYLIYPYRPKFTLKNAKEQWFFSGWMIPQAVLGYFRTQLDTFMVSAAFGQTQLGSYSTMKYIAFIPSAHIILPIVQPFLVEQRKTKNAPNYFAKQFNASFILTMLIAIPITSVMFVHHGLVTQVLLGDNWVAYSPLLGMFGLLIPAYVMSNQSMRILVIFGKTKHIFIFECIAFVLIFLALVSVGSNNIESFTLVKASVENLLSVVFLLYVAIKYTSLKNSAYLLLSFIPLSVSALIASYLSKHSSTWFENSFLNLLVASLVSFSFFYICILLFHLIIFKKLQEWQYLENLMLRMLLPVLRRFKYSA
jgi:lipopolysaccharide exporter